MSNNIVLKKGLNIPVTGEAELRVTKTIFPSEVAVKTSDFRGMLPRLLVKEGDKVLAGSPVLSDKNNPDILVTSPVSGTVKEISRGEKRKLLAVVITPDEKQEYIDFGAASLEGMSAGKVKEALMKSGLWMFLTQRPYGIVANPEATPKGIFISGFSSAPLAPDAGFVFADQTAYVQKGIEALDVLCPGKVNLTLSAEGFEANPLRKVSKATVRSIAGPHPAGNVGVQIAATSPILKDETVWTTSLLGLAVIGKFFATGKVDFRRKVAVCGPLAIQPSYVKAYPGTAIRDFSAFIGTSTDVARCVSGDLLSGENVGLDGHLGFAAEQLTLIKEGRQKELFGWMRPIRCNQFSTDHCYFSWLTPWRKYDMDTNLHGGPRAFVMSDAYYAKVVPMDIYPLYLIKACLAGDIDKMEKFGIYEVLPEDLALCEFVDPSKNYIQDIVAKGIELMRKEMA